jgi:hypothetical protein
MLKTIVSSLLCVCISSVWTLAHAQTEKSAATKALSRQEKDDIQIKVIEGNYPDVLRAIVGTLNAFEYEGIKTDSNIGLITASLPEEDVSDSTASRVASSVASALTLGIVGNDDQTKTRNRDINILVTSLNNSSNKVKVAFKEVTITATDNWVSSTKKVVTDLTDQPKIYQDFFNAVTRQLSSLRK